MGAGRKVVVGESVLLSIPEVRINCLETYHQGAIYRSMLHEDSSNAATHSVFLADPMRYVDLICYDDNRISLTEGCNSSI